MNKKRESVIGSICLLTLIACQDGAQKSAEIDNTAEEAPPITYHKDVRPLIEAKCLSCHDTGGIGTFSFADYESVKRTSAAIKIAVETKVCRLGFR